MAEVQFHGNKYEDKVIFDRTGLTKKEYDKLKENGYISKFDLVDGLLVDYNGQIKSTGGNIVCCADLLTMMSHTNNYRLIIGCYNQLGSQKVFHTQYEFFIEATDYEILWGKMKTENIEPFVTFVRGIPSGIDAQLSTLKKRNAFQEIVQCKNALMKINPKVDSKKQRRVQCSLKLNELLNSKIKYIKTENNFIVDSNRRSFKK